MNAERGAKDLLALGSKDVEEAALRLRGIAWKTPLLPASRDETRVFLKLECLQRLGSFKIRGMWNRMARERSGASPAERDVGKGYVTISAGNAGQAVAWSAQRLGAPCRVFVPETAVARKVDSMRAMGAEVIRRPHEEIMEAMGTVDFAGAAGWTFVHPFGQPEVVAGQGTVGLEILESLPDVGSVLVAVGGGGLVGGIATAIKATRPGALVVGVQAEGAAPLSRSFETGEPANVGPPRTFADGMAATRVFPYMWPLLRTRVDRAVTVTDAELARAISHLAKECHVVAEGAGAAGLAAAWKLRGTIPEPIVAVVSGGNIDPALFARISIDGPASAGPDDRTAAGDR